MPSPASEHRYGDAAAQRAELWLPGHGSPFRVCVLVHGGFWKAEYDLSLMRDLARDLVARGWAVWNVEYRRLAPGPAAARGGEWPALFADVAAAVDHLAELDAPLDLGRVAVAGHSAGGHLAAWTAGRPGLPAGAVGAAPRVTVRAAVSQAGVLDLAAKAAEDDAGAARVEALIGVRVPRDLDATGHAREIPVSRLAVTSPRHMAPLGVPTLAVHGADDDVVPVAHSEALAAADPQCELRVFSGEEHAGHLVALNPMWRAAAEWLETHVPASPPGPRSPSDERRFTDRGGR